MSVKRILKDVRDRNTLSLSQFKVCATNHPHNDPSFHKSEVKGSSPFAGSIFE